MKYISSKIYSIYQSTRTIVCERLPAMQELARLPEFLAHFAKNTLLCPGKTPPPQDWNFSWRT